MKNEQVNDIKQVMEMCKNNQRSRLEQSDVSDRPKVGDMILFNGSKTYGHVIQVMDEGLKVVDD